MKDVVKTNIQRPESSKRLRRRKRNMSIYYFIVVLLVFGIGISLSMTFLFNINEIVITGSSDYSNEQILNASGVNIGDNMVRLSGNDVEESVLNSLINIESVNIHKDFPDVLQLEVLQSVPAANVELSSGAYLIVSSKGKILKSNAEAEPTLITVKGIMPLDLSEGTYLKVNNEEKLDVYQQILDIITNNGYTEIKVIDVTDVYDIMLNYDDRIEVQIGNSSNLDYKLSYVKKVLSEEIDDREEGYLIMRGENGASFVTKDDMERYKKSLESDAAQTSETTAASDESSVSSNTSQNVSTDES